MNIGSKIKSLRKKKGYTQEYLAQELAVSAQSISKWENGTTLPDIMLLPKLSVLLGVTIDNLFELSDEDRYERIEKIISDKRFLNDTEFYALEDFLQEKVQEKPPSAKAYGLLAGLHLKKVQEHKDFAEQYAKSALELEPENKRYHLCLSWATDAPKADWNCANHHKGISYYKDFVEKHPQYRGGYLWLLDLLIADGRTEECWHYWNRLCQIDNGFIVLYYKGLIRMKEGKIEDAHSCFEEMMISYSEDWLSWFSIGDVYARSGNYTDAIKYWQTAFNTQPHPKYTDVLECMAHAYEIIGDNTNAISSYQNILNVLKSDYDITEGESVDFYKREIHRLQNI